SLEQRRKGARYPDDAAGLELFNRTSEDYFRAVVEQNQSCDEPAEMLIPSVESWAAYLGVSRQSIFRYKHERGEEWTRTIEYYINLIGACKSEAASHGRLNAVVYIFDCVNNSRGEYGYVSTNEIKLQVEPPKIDNLPDVKELSARLPDPVRVEDKKLDEYLE
ncbi:MAG: hypothetical protein J6W84_07060, partial [Bacteroidales bacterium]|nr:hypothetical protein [Bacteroidales bacterium]